MSSPPSDKRPDEESGQNLESPDRSDASDVDEVPTRAATWWARVEPWRRLMLGGAIILLLASAVRAALKDDFPDSAMFVANFGGYLLLALGFAQFFRNRRKK
jgi:hypothetical protein